MIAQNSNSNGNGQNSNNGNAHQITYLTTPKNCGWYAVWKNPTDNSTNKRWKVQILQKSTSPTGSNSYTVIEEFEQNKNYIQIPERYRNQANIAIKVSSPSNSIINNNDNNDVLETCPGCETGIIEQSFKCNGLSYAFEIKKIKNNPSSTSHYLKLSSTENYYIEPYGPSIPFYRYVNSSTFQQHFSFLHPSQYTILYNVQNNDNILDINGNLLTGTVYAIIKDLGQFNGASFTTNLLSETYYQDIFHMINTFNTYSTIINNSRPLLNCTPYPSIPNSGGGISWGGLYNDTVFNALYNEKNRKKIQEIIKLLAKNDPIFTDVQNSTGEIYSVNNYKQFSIERIDKASNPILLNPSDIYTNNGIVYPNILLENGIYKFIVWTVNNEIIPIYFESNEQILGNNNTQSDKVKIIILPVPIKENRFIARIEANERVSFEFKLLDDKGRTLHNSNHELIANEIKNIEVQYTPYLDSSQLLINRFTFEDASEKIIKTISQ
ncbi:MAG: hypothetical protein ACK4ON_03620 [Bacteroidia bacterium]